MTTLTLVAAAVWLSQFVQLPPLPLHPVPLIRSPADDMTPLALLKKQRELHQSVRQSLVRDLESTEREIKKYEAKARELRREKNEERAKLYEGLAGITKEHRYWMKFYLAVFDGTATPAEKKEWEKMEKERKKRLRDLLDKPLPTSPPASPPDRRQTPNERE